MGTLRFADLALAGLVIAGLDPAIHGAAPDMRPVSMDRRVKPGGDDVRAVACALVSKINSNAKPFQSAGEFTRRKINLQNPAVSRFERRARSVQDRCRIEPNIAGIGETRVRPASPHHMRHLGFGNTSKAV